MVSSPRLSATIWLAELVYRFRTGGDFLETGVAAGGSAMLLLQVMRQFEPFPPGSVGGAVATPEMKHLWLCDGWSGLPEPVAQLDKADERLKKGSFLRTFDIFTNTVRRHMALLVPANTPPLNNELPIIERSTVLKGWLAETLAPAMSTGVWMYRSLPPPGDKPAAPPPQLQHRILSHLSFLRVDVDMYGSTKESLEFGYPLLATSGGVVYVDDFGAFDACRIAVLEYRAAHKITDPIWAVLEDGRERYEAVYWVSGTSGLVGKDKASSDLISQFYSELTANRIPIGPSETHKSMPIGCMTQPPWSCSIDKSRA